MKGKLLLLGGLIALLLALGLAAPVSADTNRYVDPGGTCAGFSPCYTTISAAVAASGPGDTIYVFPGTYAESVDLSSMATPGDITLITVDATGTPTPWTWTGIVDPGAAGGPGTGPAIFNSVVPFPGNVTIYGLEVTSPDDHGIELRVNSDVVIDSVDAENADDHGVVVVSDTGDITVTTSYALYNGWDGFALVADGNVTIINSWADQNASDGFLIVAGGDVSISLESWSYLNVGHGFYIDADGDVSINDCTSTHNNGDGFHVEAGGNVTVNPSDTNGNGGDGFNIDAGGHVTISDSRANNNVHANSDGFQISADGDVTITGSSADGNGEEGIDVEKAGGNVTLSNCSADGNGSSGFEVENVAGDVTITGSSAEGNGLHGFDIDGGSNVTISGSSANENGEDGFHTTYTGGNVTLSSSSANGNIQDGFHVEAYGDVSIGGCSAAGNHDSGFEIYADGNVSINSSSANGNSGGFFISTTHGNVTIGGCSANGNSIDGFQTVLKGDVSISGSSANENNRNGMRVAAPGAPPGDLVDNVSIQDCHIWGNGCGIALGDLLAGGTHLVNGSIICNNVESGLSLSSEVVLNAEGNWWGDASGPSHPNNPGGTGDAIIDGSSGGSGTVDFDPWIDTISHSAVPDPVAVGQPTTVSFQFSGGGGVVFLGQGPGDPNDTPPFTLSTNNGSLTDSDETGTTVHEFINKSNGILSVILIPDNWGTAVVSLDGSCNLGDSIATEERVSIGGEAYPINKLTILAPWLALTAAIIAGATIVLRRRRAQG